MRWSDQGAFEFFLSLRPRQNAGIGAGVQRLDWEPCRVSISIVTQLCVSGDICERLALANVAAASQSFGLLLTVNGQVGLQQEFTNDAVCIQRLFVCVVAVRIAANRE